MLSSQSVGEKMFVLSWSLILYGAMSVGSQCFSLYQSWVTTPSTQPSTEHLLEES